jgi:hypothetical protein
MQLPRGLGALTWARRLTNRPLFSRLCSPIGSVALDALSFAYQASKPVLNQQATAVQCKDRTGW